MSKSKLEPTARKGIFVGYCDGTKGYRVWIPSEKKVEISRDVWLACIKTNQRSTSDVKMARRSVCGADGE